MTTTSRTSRTRRKRNTGTLNVKINACQECGNKKPILKLDSKRTAKVITALLNADKEHKSKFSLACMDAATRLDCCPACESKDVERVMYTCYPPIIDLKCKKCGWRSR